MRVAIVTESFLPSLNGVTTSVCQVADHLRARGHDAVIVAPRAREAMPDRYADFPVHRVASVPVRRFDVGLPTGEIEDVLAEATPDVVHVASPFVIGARGLRAAGRLGLPTVAIFQTDMAAYVRQHTPGPAGAAAARTTWRWIRRIHSWADLTLAPSTVALADLRAHGVPRTALWGRGVDTGLFSPAWRADALARALRRELAPHGEQLLGYIGRLAPEKELERLADVADLPGTRLVIVGEGPSRESVGAILAEAVANSSGRPNLPPVFLGSRRGEDLARAYAALDLFVHTGTHETFGQTLQEAGASGLPVVAPRAGGPIDLVTEGENGHLFEPDVPGSLRGAVCRSLESRHHLAELGRRGLERVRERSWASTVDRLIEHYEDVATRDSANAA